MRAYERLLRYVKFNTESDEETLTHPSTENQFILANELASELKELGCDRVQVSDKCYVYAKLSATAGYEDAPKLGFIAHMDTSPDFSGEGVNPIIHENYSGEDIVLDKFGTVLSSSTFPHLSRLKGRTLITTSGNTLLGADDKAGIAEIMTLIEKIKVESLAHGPLRFAFTPDEEIGEGADNFDVELFDADFAYTVDGGEEGSLEYENFNAAAARFEIKGFNVHPGSAKNTMINAALVAIEINSMLPGFETPSHTDGYDGFYHLTDINGDVGMAKLYYIIRDHDHNSYMARLNTLAHIEEIINEKYGEGTCELSIREQYKNMATKIAPCMHLIDNAKLATERAGITPTVEPIRGGTDGARLSFMGLPCPNLGTGGYAFHGPYEHITVEGMDKVVEILANITDIYKSQITEK